MRSRYPLLFAKGLAMGAADVVPGVSGGTIAFISGIYDELIDSIKGINLALVKTLFREGPVACWRRANATFLVVLFAGILTSVFTLANLISHLLATYPIHLWAFFFGLILASIVYIYRQQTRWGMLQVLAFLLGGAAALVVSFSPPLAVSVSPVSIFLAGMLSICAMILPGISGSFILLLIGMYPVIIGAVSALNFTVLGLFAAGAVAGLLAFSRLLSWLLHHQRPTTLSVLTGFLAGSLAVVWPWQHQPPQPGEGGAWSRQLMLPETYQAATGEAHLVAAVLLMLVGVVTVLGLEYLGSRMTPSMENS